MTIVRAFLVLQGLIFGFAGAWTLLDHNAVAALLDFTLPTGTAVVDFMSMYGGFVLGFGGFLVWCALRKAYVPAGLLALVFAVGAAAVARGMGMMTQGAVKPLSTQLLGFEIGTMLLGGLFLRYVLRQARLG